MRKPKLEIPPELRPLVYGKNTHLFGESGCGKSFVALDLALRASLAGERVLLVTSDPLTGRRALAWARHNRITEIPCLVLATHRRTPEAATESVRKGREMLGGLDWLVADTLQPVLKDQAGARTMQVFYEPAPAEALGKIKSGDLVVYAAESTQRIGFRLTQVATGGKDVFGDDHTSCAVDWIAAEGCASRGCQRIRAAQPYHFHPQRPSDAMSANLVTIPASGNPTARGGIEGSLNISTESPDTLKI